MQNSNPFLISHLLNFTNKKQVLVGLLWRWFYFVLRIKAMQINQNFNLRIYPSSLAAAGATEVFGILRRIFFRSSGGCSYSFIIRVAHNRDRNSRFYLHLVFEINWKLFNKRQKKLSEAAWLPYYIETDLYQSWHFTNLICKSNRK